MEHLRRWLKLIVANCRARITQEDLDFVVDTLASSDADQRPLRDLTTDPQSLDTLLDDPTLFARLLEAPDLLHVSPYFFYYVVVRRSFLDHGLDHRRAADYVGALLSFYLQRAASSAPHGGNVYLVDLMTAMSEARSPDETFALQTEIGNQALYLAGVFPDWIYHRHTFGRRPVRLEYYEQMGRQSYAAAASTDVARRHDLVEVLDYLATEFPALRLALNDLVDDHLHLARRPETIDRLFRQALYRQLN